MSGVLKPLIVVLEPIHSEGLTLLRNAGDVTVLDGSHEGHNEVLHDATVLVVRSTWVGAELLDKMPSLRVIGRHGAGLDTIDLEECERRGIAVVNTPRSNTLAVAEHVITVMLMLLKRVHATEKALRNGEFDEHSGSLPGQVVRAGLVGREAADTSLGLVGAGAIGLAVAQRAAALGMRVFAFDPFLSPESAESFPGTIVGSLPELLRSSDVVSLHVPGTHGAGPLIGAAEIEQMRDGALFINAARGSLVDSTALAAALESGRLDGAAVDVFEKEPPERDHPLMTAPNIIVTPHAAAMTDMSLLRMAVDVASRTLSAFATSHESIER